MSKKNKVKNPHDQFFRTAMSDARVAQNFLKTWLPQDLSEQVDWSLVELQPRSFINEVRQESEVDVLFKTKIAEQDAYFYFLLEHQSKPDPLMAFRLLKYLCNIMDGHLKRYKTGRLPLVYPVVLYHGQKPYVHSTDICDLVDAPRDLVTRYFLKPFQLIDLSNIADEELKKHAWSGVMEWALKHIFSRDILPWIKDISHLMRELDHHGGRDFIAIVLQYILERGEVSDEHEFFALIDTQISPEVGEQIMSLAKQLKDAGRKEGMQQGMQQGMKDEKRTIAKRMFHAGSDSSFIVQVTGLSLEEVDALKKH